MFEFPQVCSHFAWAEVLWYNYATIKFPTKRLAEVDDDWCNGVYIKDRR